MGTIKDGTHGTCGTHGSGRNYNGTFTELFGNYFSCLKRRIRGSVFKIQQGVLKRVQEFRGTLNIKPIYLIYIKRIFGLKEKTFASARAWLRGTHREKCYTCYILLHVLQMLYGGLNHV